MMTAIETAPVMDLRPQEVENLVEELQAYHAIYSPLFQRREHALVSDVHPIEVANRGHAASVVRPQIV